MNRQTTTMRLSGLSSIHAAACLLVLLPTERAAAQERATAVSLSALQNKEELVLSVGSRLAVAAVNLCRQRAPALGVTIHEFTQYSPAYRDTARAMFARPDLPAILAVAEGQPAARAGIRRGDAIVAVNGEPVPPQTRDGLARVEAVVAQMERSTRGGIVRLTIDRDQHRIERAFAPALACAARFQVEPAGKLDAASNGWLIQITTALADFVQGPDELAAVLAHELAHVILNHRAMIGRVSVAESRSEELAADRLGVRLANKAGFRAEAAAEFWRRIKARGGPGPSGLGRHPGDGQRLEAVKAALREIDVNQAGSNR